MSSEDELAAPPHVRQPSTEQLHLDEHSESQSSSSSSSDDDSDNEAASSSRAPSGQFPPPPMPPLPSRPFPPPSVSPRTAERLNRYRVSPDGDEDAAGEGESTDEQSFESFEADVDDAVANAVAFHAVPSGAGASVPSAAASAASAQSHEHEDHTAEEDDQFTALTPIFGRARSGRAARVGVSAEFNMNLTDSSSDEEGNGDNDDDDDDDNEASMVIHSENGLGRKPSLSHSALEHFASPPPPIASPQHRLAGAFDRAAPPSGPSRAAPPVPTAVSSSSAAAAAAAAAASKEEVATIEYYLRQAIQAKDIAALGDLVARANEKNIHTDLVSTARSLLIDAKAEVSTHTHYSIFRDALLGCSCPSPTVAIHPI
jgi:hypothetical protein